MKFEIGFLGYGAMARAISSGLAESGLYPYEKQIVSGRDRAKLDQAASERGLAAAADNRELVRSCQTVVLGVKPHQVMEVLEDIKNEANERLIISLAAGINLKQMRPVLPSGAGLVRAMPNVAALVGQGTTLICAPPGTGPDHLKKALAIFESVGLCLEMPEKYFAAGGAVSGSGPAYFFDIMEGLVRGAARLGLPWSEARSLVINTALGSAVMAQKMDGAAFSELRDMVTSPGGTTAEALYVFEKGGLGGMLQEALEAAVEKSRKLV